LAYARLYASGPMRPTWSLVCPLRSFLTFRLPPGRRRPGTAPRPTTQKNRHQGVPWYRFL